MTGLLLLCVVVTLTVVAGLAHRSRDGRLREARAASRSVPTTGPGGAVASQPRQDPAVRPAGDLSDVLARLGQTPGPRATLLQFSSAFCAPCRATRRVLTEVSAMVEGVTHVEVDAEQHLDLVRRLGIHKTPTTLVLDGRVREVKRASGQPRKADVLAALGQALP